MESLVFSGDPLSSQTVTFIISLALAVFLGILLGAERESRGKDAGISTNALVVAGSMLFTFMSILIDPEEPARIASQVVVGIGFLGAGLIWKEGATVRNLTTAASMWMAAAIGVTVGAGYYAIAIIATTAALIIPRIPHLHDTPPPQTPKE